MRFLADGCPIDEHGNLAPTLAWARTAPTSSLLAHIGSGDFLLWQLSCKSRADRRLPEAVRFRAAYERVIRLCDSELQRRLPGKFTSTLTFGEFMDAFPALPEDFDVTTLSDEELYAWAQHAWKLGLAISIDVPDARGCSYDRCCALQETLNDEVDRRWPVGVQ